MTRISHFGDMPSLHRASLDGRQGGIGLTMGAMLGGLIALGTIALLTL
ncbi:hypothetical protein ABHV46_03845 [Asaia sp. BMEF1]